MTVYRVCRSMVVFRVARGVVDNIGGFCCGFFCGGLVLCRGYRWIALVEWTRAKESLFWLVVKGFRVHLGGGVWF